MDAIEVGDVDASAKPIRGPTDARLIVFLVRYFHPGGENRFQFAHVVEGEGEGLEPRNGGLGKVGAVNGADGLADVALSEAQLQTLRFKLDRERLRVERDLGN